jgi:hypothetical protein
VSCITFDSLCRKHGVTTVDLVHIDTEGYDFEVVRLVDLDTRRPRLLLYEHLHLDEDTRRQCRAYVEARGYEQLSDAVDTVCLRTIDLTPRDRPLAELWSTLGASSR